MQQLLCHCVSSGFDFFENEVDLFDKNIQTTYPQPLSQHPSVFLTRRKKKKNCFLALHLLGVSKSWFFFSLCFFFLTYKIHPRWIIIVGQFDFYLWSPLAEGSPRRYSYFPHKHGNLTNSSTSWKRIILLAIINLNSSKDMVGELGSYDIIMFSCCSSTWVWQHCTVCTVGPSQQKSEFLIGWLIDM